MLLWEEEEAFKIAVCSSSCLILLSCKEYKARIMRRVIQVSWIWFWCLVMSLFQYFSSASSSLSTWARRVAMWEVTRSTSDGAPSLLLLPPVPSRHISSTLWPCWLVIVSSLLGDLRCSSACDPSSILTIKSCKLSDDGTLHFSSLQWLSWWAHGNWSWLQYFHRLTFSTCSILVLCIAIMAVIATQWILLYYAKTRPPD